jgi:hypothetical protein
LHGEKAGVDDQVRQVAEEQLLATGFHKLSERERPVITGSGAWRYAMRSSGCDARLYSVYDLIMICPVREQRTGLRKAAIHHAESQIHTD